jgi:hypothetical protein
LKTGKGPESFAKFFIGNNRKRASDIFRKLEGMHEFSETNVLYIDFMEMVMGLPVTLDVITCTLDQLAKNCRIITKELFKSENLENF